MAELGELRRGRRWAYRIARSSATFHEAAVVKVGDKKVQVEPVADRWEGKRSANDHASIGSGLTSVWSVQVRG